MERRFFKYLLVKVLVIMVTFLKGVSNLMTRLLRLYRSLGLSLLVPSSMQKRTKTSRKVIVAMKIFFLHLRKSRKKRNTDRKYVKWLGVIFDDSLLRHALEVAVGQGKKGTWGVEWGGWITMGYVSGGVEEGL